MNKQFSAHPLLLRLAVVALTSSLSFASQTSLSDAATARWTEEQANKWYQKQGWLVGANFNPNNAINELEMWQAETFDPARIDTELGWAEALGMNTMRVYLHDLLWQQDSEGFKKRIDTFLSICKKHRIKPILVVFDSCWDPHPKLGPQHPPVPGVHNSGWVQSPGADALQDESQYPRLKQYVQGVIGAFANDDRVLAWDVWNEPNNTNASSYGKLEPKNKEQLVANLLPQVFAWAREVKPTQPLTSGVWDGDWSPSAKLTDIQKIQLNHSDVISFHNYGWPEDFEQRVQWLQSYGRPLLCTEYMARGNGSTFDTILPIARRYRVAAINWGLVQGKSQTHLPWDSWQKPYVIEPPTIWFHEVFYPDGKPYREQEVKLIKELTSTEIPISAK
jgi:hypothetical protein